MKTQIFSSRRKPKRSNFLAAANEQARVEAAARAHETREAKLNSFQVKLVGTVLFDHTGRPYQDVARFELRPTVPVDPFGVGRNAHAQRCLLRKMAADCKLLAVFDEKTTDLSGVATVVRFAVSPHYIWPNKSVCGPKAPRSIHESVHHALKKAGTWTKPRRGSFAGRKPTRERRTVAAKELNDDEYDLTSDDCADAESDGEWEEN